MPRQPSPNPKTRLNLEVSESVRTLLEDLRKRTDADSLTEVIRRAVAVYDVLVATRATIILHYPDGHDETLRIVLLQPGRRQPPRRRERARPAVLVRGHLTHPHHRKYLNHVQSTPSRPQRPHHPRPQR